MAPAIFFLRLWMAFAVLVNLGIVITFHARAIPRSNEFQKLKARQDEYFTAYLYEYTWEDYAVIISSVVLLPAYLYSIWGKKSFVSNKYTRAVLMLLPALFLIGVQLRQVDLRIRNAKMLNERRPGVLEPYNPFSCANSTGRVDEICAVFQSYTFMPIVVGFFTIIEVTVTLFRGPLHSAKEAYL